MQIYRLQRGETAFLEFVDEKDARVFIDSERRNNPSWKPLDVYVTEGDEDFREGEPEHGAKDFLRFNDSWACNERAYFVLKEQCEGDVEFLPLHCSGKMFYWINTIVVIDALDTQRSKYVRDTFTGKISFIGVYVFKLDDLLDKMLFFLVDDHESLFATQKFVDLVLEEKLEGLVFLPEGSTI